MSEERWEVVDEVAGEIQAEILRGLLEAQGIKVWLNQEGAGRAYGLSFGPLGTVQILVPSSELEKARLTLEAYYNEGPGPAEPVIRDDDDVDLEDID